MLKLTEPLKDSKHTAEKKKEEFVRSLTLASRWVRLAKQIARRIRSQEARLDNRSYEYDVRTLISSNVFEEIKISLQYYNPYQK